MSLQLSESLSQPPAALPPPTQMAALDPAALSLGGSAMDMVGGLVLVVAVIYALAWVLKRLQGAQGGGLSALKVRAGMSVGPREKVLLVQAAQTYMLVAVAPGNVRTLHVFPEAPKLTEAVSADGAEQPWMAKLQTALKARP